MIMNNAFYAISYILGQKQNEKKFLFTLSVLESIDDDDDDDDRNLISIIIISRTSSFNQIKMFINYSNVLNVFYALVKQKKNIILMCRKQNAKIFEKRFLFLFFCKRILHLVQMKIAFMKIGVSNRAESINILPNESNQLHMFRIIRIW